MGGEDEAETTLVQDLLKSARMLSRFSKTSYVFGSVAFGYLCQSCMWPLCASVTISLAKCLS